MKDEKIVKRVREVLAEHGFERTVEEICSNPHTMQALDLFFDPTVQKNIKTIKNFLDAQIAQGNIHDLESLQKVLEERCSEKRFAIMIGVIKIITGIDYIKILS